MASDKAGTREKNLRKYAEHKGKPRTREGDAEVPMQKKPGTQWIDPGECGWSLVGDGGRRRFKTNVTIPKVSISYVGIHVHIYLLFTHLS